MSRKIEKEETKETPNKRGKRGMTGKTKASQDNLIKVHDVKDNEFFSEAGKKGNEVKKERKRFKMIFEEILTEEKQTVIASDFVDMLLDNNLNPKTRVAIFELILKILGEGDEKLTKNEFNTLAETIELKIV